MLVAKSSKCTEVYFKSINFNTGSLWQLLLLDRADRCVPRIHRRFTLDACELVLAAEHFFAEQMQLIGLNAGDSMAVTPYRAITSNAIICSDFYKRISENFRDQIVPDPGIQSVTYDAYRCFRTTFLAARCASAIFAI